MLNFFIYYIYFRVGVSNLRIIISSTGRFLYKEMSNDRCVWVLTWSCVVQACSSGSLFNYDICLVNSCMSYVSSKGFSPWSVILYFTPSSHLHLSLRHFLQMPNIVQKVSSAPRHVLVATPCPKALAPHWIKALMTHQQRPRVNVPLGRKHWIWSSAGSKGRGRRMAGLKTSRWAVARTQTLQLSDNIVSYSLLKSFGDCAQCLLFL